jgi:hypothetical protein
MTAFALRERQVSVVAIVGNPPLGASIWDFVIALTRCV